MRIFQTSPRLSSVSRWNWSRLPRWKAPSLCRWRDPLLFTPYRLMPTCAVVPGGTENQTCCLFLLTIFTHYSLLSSLSADLLLASSQSWPAPCSCTALNGRREAPVAVSRCPSGPAYGQWVPPPGESVPGRHRQWAPPCSAQDRLAADQTQMETDGESLGEGSSLWGFDQYGFFNGWSQYI